MWPFLLGRSQVVCSTKLLSSVYRADLCPSDPNVVCCSGDGLLRFFRVQEGSFRLIPLLLRREPQNYLCHCWLDNDKARRRVTPTFHHETYRVIFYGPSTS